MDVRELEAYEFIREEELPEIHGTGYLLRHRKSGARIALIGCDDENKVFSVAFRTPPEDSTGVAHILEHSVLCGSRDFPVKDPFVELVKGSLNTFLNAMTYPDKTIYPVASCNDKDFQNLMHIYLDAVFYPNIYAHEEIFRQEGWSYELDKADGELKYNGVVYNEMKGVFSSPDGVMEREVFNSLFPDTCYGVESGGDPDVIPDLTYEAFLDFHRRYYHPSNSYIYLYGNMDMAEKLVWIDEHYLRFFDRTVIDSEIRTQQPFDGIRTIEAAYSVAEEEPLEDNTYLSYNRVIGDALNPRLLSAFDILDYALLSAPGAPLEEALLEAGIGKDISGSFETEVRQPFYSIVARNANEEDKERFVQVVEDVLGKLVRDGIDEKSLAAGINYYEFRAREADFGHYPKGLMYGFQVMDSWLYDEDKPFLNMHSLEEYQWLRSQIGTGYFEKLIDTYLLSNRHGSLVSAKPVRGLSAARDRELKEKLAQYKMALPAGEQEKLVKAAEHLRMYQEAPDAKEDIEKIPILARTDIKRSARPFSNEEIREGDTLILRHDYETNGIGYVRLLFSLDGIPSCMWPYISVLQNVLGVIDTADHKYGDLFNEINLCTGGIGTELSVYGEYGDGNEKKYHPYFEIKSKALYDKMAMIFKYTQEFLCGSRFEDTKRLHEILSQSKSRLQMKFLSAGHQVAVVRSMSYDSEAARFKDTTEGIAYYNVICGLEEHFEERKHDLTDVLRVLTSMIFRPERMTVSYTGSAGETEALKDDVCHFKEQLVRELSDIRKMPEGFEESASDLESALRPDDREGFGCASKVQYVAVTGNFRDSKLDYSGAMNILRPVLSYDYLWNNVRVKGGAYGCMSSMARNGDTYFVSYRDPHLERTIDVYQGIPEFLEHFEADERSMTKYIIGAVSDMDIPLPAAKLGDRSLTAFLTRTPYEAMQKERDQVLDASEADIRALAAQTRAVLSSGKLCVIGGEEKLREKEGLFRTIRNLL